MAVTDQDTDTDVDSPELMSSLQEVLGPEEIRQLAELIYKLMKEELRIERERLGR